MNGDLSDLLTGADTIKIPEETWLEFAVRIGLYFGAVFQLICILSLLFLKPNSDKRVEDLSIDSSIASPATAYSNASSPKTPVWQKKQKLEKKKRR